MACTGLTGLPKVWCQVCEAFRSTFGILDDEYATAWAEVNAGHRDAQASEDVKGFTQSVFAARLYEMGAPQEIIDVARNVADMEFPSNILYGGMTYLGWISAVLGGYATLAQLPAQYMIAGEMKLARPDPTTAWRMRWRSPPSGTVASYLRDLGWSDDLITSFGAITRPRLGPDDLLRAQYRMGQGAGAANEELTKQGYEGEDITKLQALGKFIPGTGDLVRMAVREAWRDDVAAKWGYDQDFPAQFATEMERQGDTEGWSRKFWRAHWELPGVTLGMEMLHRVPEFSKSDFKELLKISDIPATFRDYITQVAYRTLTRVDVRRMHATGVLNTAQVKKSYLDFGYNDSDAQKMTEFTVRFNADKEREFTKSDILGGYKSGTISRSDARSWLQQIGYDANTAELLILRVETQMAQTYVNEQIKYVKTLFTNGNITEADARTRLGSLGLDSGRITQYIAEWTLARISKTKRPAQSTLDKFFRRDVITQGKYLEGLSNLGYSTEYAGWYLDSVLEDKAEDARKVEEAARKEQDDIILRKIKSSYQISKALIDVDIAELQTAIAETQLALRSRTLRFDRERDAAEKIGTSAEIKEKAAADTKAVQAEIRGLQTASAGKKASIEVLQTEIVAIELASTPQPKEITPGESAVAIRERVVKISVHQEEIEGYQTAIAKTELAILEMTDEAAITAAELEIAQRKVSIELVQDAIAKLETEIENIELTRTIQVIETPPDVAEKEIRTRRLAIETAQDEIATIAVNISTLNEEITTIATQLISDLEIAKIAMNVAELEREYATDLKKWTERLDNLRINLSDLREQKAVLTVEYREGIAP